MRFRSRHLDERLLDVDQVAAWIGDRRISVPTGAVVVATRRDRAELSDGRVLRVLVVHDESRELLEVDVPSRGALDELGELGEHLERTYAWQPGAGASFVLSGITPWVHPLSAPTVTLGVTVARDLAGTVTTATRVVLHVDPAVSRPTSPIGTRRSVMRSSTTSTGLSARAATACRSSWRRCRPALRGRTSYARGPPPLTRSGTSRVHPAGRPYSG